MGVRAIYQLATPWTADKVFDLGYEQGADVMIFTHLDHRQTRLTRYGHADWRLTYPDFIATVAAPAVLAVTPDASNTGTGYEATTYTYVVTTIDEATGQESLPTDEETGVTDLSLKGNSNALTWTAVAGAERYNVYRKGGGAFGFIGTTETTDFLDDNIAPDFSQSYPRQKQPFGTGLDDSDNDGNKPAAVAFWQQRAIYARTLNKPNGVFASQSGNLFNFNAARPISPSDAVTFAVSSRRVNAIMHLVPLKNLLVLTTDTVFSIGKDFEPTNIEIDPESYRGSSRVRPIVIDDVVMFNPAKGGAIRTLGYQFEADGYRGNDLTVFAPHLFRDVRVSDMTWAEFPASTVSAVMSDGAVRSLTWQAEQDVWGWSKTWTQGVYESCCTVSENGEDVVYYVVRRTVGGVEKRFIEYTATSRWTDVAEAVYLDSARTYNGEPATRFLGMGHLAGETITVLADGAVIEDVVVDAEGGFDLDYAASKVVAGLSYESWIRTLPFSEGDYKGEPISVASVAVHVLRTRGIEVGLGKELPPGVFEPTSSDDEIAGLIDEVKTRDQEPLGEPTRLYSGVLSVDLGCDDWQSGTVVVRQRYPLPMHVIGLTPDYVGSE